MYQEGGFLVQKTSVQFAKFDLPALQTKGREKRRRMYVSGTQLVPWGRRLQQRRNSEPKSRHTRSVFPLPRTQKCLTNPIILYDNCINRVESYLIFALILFLFSEKKTVLLTKVILSYCNHKTSTSF